MTERTPAGKERDLIRTVSINIVPVKDPASEIPKIARDYAIHLRSQAENAAWFKSSVEDDDFYIAQFVDPFDTHHHALLVQMNEGKVAGVAELLKGEGAEYGPSDKPFTRMTETKMFGEEQMGRGMRRLRVLDSYAQRMFNGERLYSGRHLEPNAEKMWQKLLDEGIAEPGPKGSKYRIKAQP